jgi:hypothetical protein
MWPLDCLLSGNLDIVHSISCCMWPLDCLLSGNLDIVQYFIGEVTTV